MKFFNQLNNFVYRVYSNPYPLLLLLISVWMLVWKGLALWRAAKKNQKYWFVTLLVINTLGLLEILYLFVFSDLQLKKLPFIGRKKKTEEPGGQEAKS